MIARQPSGRSARSRPGRLPGRRQIIGPATHRACVPPARMSVGFNRASNMAVERPARIRSPPPLTASVRRTLKGIEAVGTTIGSSTGREIDRIRELPCELLSGRRRRGVGNASLRHGAPPTPFRSLACRRDPVCGALPTVGYLLAGPSQCKLAPRDEAFYQGLRDLGYIPGQNITVDRRCFSTGDEMRNVLRGFVNRRWTSSSWPPPHWPWRPNRHQADSNRVQLLWRSSKTALWPAWLAREETSPGWRASRRSSSGSGSTAERGGSKSLRVAALLNPDNPGTRPTLKALDEAGRALGIQIQRVEFRNVGELDKAFRSAATGGATAVLVQDDPHALAGRINRGVRPGHRLPAVAGVPKYAEAGGLIAYGPSRSDLYRRAATFVDKILKGAKPGDLPSSNRRSTT